jgi:FK506-binding nuclear protein
MKKNIIYVLIVLIVVAVLIFITTKEKNNKMSEEQNIKTEETNPVSVDDSQIAKTGDTVAMKYTGKLKDGTVFDSTDKHGGDPFVFTLGIGQVIKGWDTGIVGMKIGEKKTLTIPPEEGYGSQNIPGIPPNSTLIFDVELVAIK